MSMTMLLPNANRLVKTVENLFSVLEGVRGRAPYEASCQTVVVSDFPGRRDLGRNLTEKTPGGEADKMAERTR